MKGLKGYPLADGSRRYLGRRIPPFVGDPARWNPEELLVAALSSSHQLWYLHLCAAAGVVVVEYFDHA